MYLTTTEDLPLPASLQSVGIELLTRQTVNYDDMGGKRGNEREAPAFNLGARFIADPIGPRIQFIYDGGSLQAAGLAAGDVIIAIDNIQVSKEKINMVLEPYSINDSIKFTVFRGDLLMEFNVMLDEAKEDTYYLEITERESENRNNWLHKVS